MSRSRNLYFRNVEKHGFSAYLSQIWYVLEKKINDMVNKVNVSTIDSKTRIDQEGQGQGNKISIFKSGRKQEFLVNLEQYW